MSVTVKVARQHSEAAEVLAVIVDEASGQPQVSVADTTDSELRGREKAISVLTKLIDPRADRTASGGAGAAPLRRIAAREADGAPVRGGLPHRGGPPVHATGCEGLPFGRLLAQSPLKLALLTCVALFAACGGEADAPSSDQPADRPAPPPPGWRTVTNPKAAFSVAAPRSWRVSQRPRATLISSPDRTVAVTVVGDRSPAGRETDADTYARQTLTELPGFEGSVDAEPKPVGGSPYSSAQVQGRGKLPRSRALQRITVAAFHRPKRVTYAVVAFRQREAPIATVERVLASVRGG